MGAFHPIVVARACQTVDTLSPAMRTNGAHWLPHDGLMVASRLLQLPFFSFRQADSGEADEDDGSDDEVVQCRRELQQLILLRSNYKNAMVRGRAVDGFTQIVESASGAAAKNEPEALKTIEGLLSFTSKVSFFLFLFFFFLFLFISFYFFLFLFFFFFTFFLFVSFFLTCRYSL